jgi:hypothetical protein
MADAVGDDDVFDGDEDRVCICGGEHERELARPCAGKELGSSKRCTVNLCEGGLEPLGSMRERTSRSEPARGTAPPS